MSGYKFRSICFVFKIKPALRLEVGEELSQKIIDRMKWHYEESDKRQPRMKGILRFHQMLLLLGLSLYRAMEEELGKAEDLVMKTHKILWGGMRRSTGIMAFMIRHTKDPFNLYLYVMGPKNEWFFPCPPWKKVEIELENGIGWHQLKCPYYEFFKDEGVVELTDAYCNIDRRIAELLPEHLELKRQRTLAKGDDLCDFFYYRRGGKGVGPTLVPK